MNRELSKILGLPESTSANRIVVKAVRTCAGGSEILDMKEWLNGVANAAISALRDPARSRYAEENRARLNLAQLALDRLAAAEAALLRALEQKHNLPSGELTNRMRTDTPAV
jgi:hypothetical protein